MNRVAVASFLRFSGRVTRRKIEPSREWIDLLLKSKRWGIHILSLGADVNGKVAKHITYGGLERAYRRGVTKG